MSEVSASEITGKPAGLDFQYTGGHCAFGRSGPAALIAACTAPAAVSRSTERSNWVTMLAPPMPLKDDISTTPGISPMVRSSGCASDAATVVGLTPGNGA